MTQQEQDISQQRMLLDDLTRPGIDLTGDPESWSWLSRCAAAARSGSLSQADALANLLDDGQQVAAAFEHEQSWPGARGETNDDLGGARASAARAVLSVTYAALDPSGAQARLSAGEAHWRRANVLLEPTATHGYAHLILLALSGGLLDPLRQVHAAVVFGGPDGGASATLTVAVQPGGPPGLYPDPRSMTFLTVNSEFAGSLAVAWRSAPVNIRHLCVVWGISHDRNPFRKVPSEVGGGSLGAAFGVALHDLARAARPLGKARIRRLDPGCAVTGSLDPQGRLLPVTHYKAKFTAARSEKWRVVAPDDPEAVKFQDIPKHVDYAPDLGTAIRKSHLLRLRPHGMIALTVALALASAGGGTAALAARSGESAADAQANTAAVAAISGQLATRSEGEDTADPFQAAELAAASWRLAPTARARAVARVSLLDVLSQPDRGVLATPGASVNAVAFSPDGKSLATGGSDGAARLWKIATQSPVGTPMTADSNPVTAVAFSPNGMLLATASDDGTARLWSVVTHQQVGAPMTADGKPLNAVAFSPDGMLLATASDDGTARLWSVPTHRQIGMPMNPAGSSVLAVAFSPDGETLATAVAGYAVVWLWDVAAQQPVEQLSFSNVEVVFRGVQP